MDASIKAAIAATKAEWREFFSGTLAGANAFLEEMVTDLATATMNGDEAMVTTIKAQFRAIAETHRLRAKNAAWDVAFAWIRTAVRAALLAAGKI